MKPTTFLDKCKGIALVCAAFSLLLFGAAALVYSASPAQADVGPQTTYSGGKYMMDLQSMVVEGNPNWYVLVWDTETGNSKFYYVNAGSAMGVGARGYQLPSSPL